MQTESKAHPAASPPATTHFTTTWGGVAIIVASLLTLVATFGFLVPAVRPYFAQWVSILTLISSLIFAAAASLFARGVRGEGGIVGGSRTGQIALVIFGSAGVAGSLIRVLSGNPPTDVGRLLGNFSLPFSILAMGSGLLAAVVIARAGIIRGRLRWGVIVVAGWTLFESSLSVLFLVSYNAYSVLYMTGAIHAADIFQRLLMIALGVGFALHGRTSTDRRDRQRELQVLTRNAD